MNLLFSAVALAEFLSPYGEAHDFLVEPHKDTVAIVYQDSEIIIDTRKANPHLQALEIALTFSETDTDKEATNKDFLLFAEREEFLDSLPKSNEDDESIETGISEADKMRFQAFRELIES